MKPTKTLLFSIMVFTLLTTPFAHAGLLPDLFTYWKTPVEYINIEYAEIQLKQDYIQINNGIKTKIYPQEYSETIHRPDDTILVYSQRYIVEYKDKQSWIQLGSPISVEYVNDTIVKTLLDPDNSTVEITYHITNDLKTDVKINTVTPRYYRIRWLLDGIFRVFDAVL